MPTLYCIAYPLIAVRKHQSQAIALTTPLLPLSLRHFIADIQRLLRRIIYIYVLRIVALFEMATLLVVFHRVVVRPHRMMPSGRFDPIRSVVPIDPEQWRRFGLSGPPPAHPVHFRELTS